MTMTAPRPTAKSHGAFSKVPFSQFANPSMKSTSPIVVRNGQALGCGTKYRSPCAWEAWEAIVYPLVDSSRPPVRGLSQLGCVKKCVREGYAIHVRRERWVDDQ